MLTSLLENLGYYAIIWVVLWHVSAAFFSFPLIGRAKVRGWSPIYPQQEPGLRISEPPAFSIGQPFKE